MPSKEESPRSNATSNEDDNENRRNDREGRKTSPSPSPPRERRRTSRERRSSGQRRKRSSRSRSRSKSRSPRRDRDARRGSRDVGSRRRNSSPIDRRRFDEKPPESRCLGVFNLSRDSRERDLERVFKRYGPLDDVVIVYDRQTQRSRGFAFVYFENIEDARDARDDCSGMDIDGRRIRVDFSFTNKPHSPTPGVYMGRPARR